MNAEVNVVRQFRSVFVYAATMSSVRFRCKFVNLRYLVIKEYLLKNGVKERTMVYVRKSCLACPAAELGISIRTHYPSLS